MTRVALLWHMHQPFYQDLVTGEHILPWVRLHALKDYYGMVALLREFPNVRMTFNLVPSLLVQLEAFAEDRARDRSLELSLKPAAHLTPDDRAFIVANFFHAQRQRMIEPYPRYVELLRKREERANGREQAADAFSEADLRDLQVWHKLAWIDPLYMDGDARVRALLQKGRNYDEDDKAVLRAVELEILRRVIPEYADAAQRGQIEIATSPFFHPILPLLCDTDIYLRTHPQSRMPRQRFRHPEDAAAQLERAAAYHERLFGARPVGLWPSEGSVSDAMVPLARDAGFQWMATDELILARSLGVALTRDGGGHLMQPEVLYKPYTVRAGEREIACVFRDHVLSDLIGFTYSNWGPQDAANDFVGRLAEAGRRYSARAGGDALISVILDGENAWEHFEGQGRPFLRALYRALSEHPELTTVTMRDACAGGGEAINGIFPGSWINGDFYIWIGHQDDQRGWGQLADARQVLEAAEATTDPAMLERAREELYVAEGSDWFWWYGDDHSSEHDLEFDDLFRRHLRNVYRMLDRPVPDELFLTNISTDPPRTVAQAPTGFVYATVDGRVTSYFEWLGAGTLDLRSTGGSMHQVTETTQALTSRILFGFDPEHLYVRVDFRRPAADLLVGAAEIRLSFLTPADVRVRVGAPGGGGLRAVLETKRAEWIAAPVLVEAAAHAVLEVGLPFRGLGVRAGDPVSFFVSLHIDGTELERYPSHRPIDVVMPAEDFDAYNWTA